MCPAHNRYRTQVKAMHCWAEILNRFLLRELELPYWSGLSQGEGFRHGWRVRTGGYHLFTILTATPSHPFPSPYNSLPLITHLNSYLTHNRCPV